MNLSKEVGEAFFGSFKTLTQIQQLAIPAVIGGDDVLIRSATASGKTEAGLAPLIGRLLPEMRQSNEVVVVIICPTKALVNDLFRRIELPLSRVGLRTGIRHGERNNLNRETRPHVLLTTPESFDIIVGKEKNLVSNIRAIVLDEAHLLYNTQRGLQIALSIRRLEILLESEIQLVALSATIAKADEVWRFFRPNNSVVDVKATGSRDLHLQIRYLVSHTDLAEMTRRLDGQKILIFVNSRREAEQIAEAITQANVKNTTTSEVSVFVHHAALSKEIRENVELQFGRLSAGICVATPTLELGIDIGAIDLVVNYGVPNSWQSLLQRVGRGNRRKGYIEALMCVPAHNSEKLQFLDALAFQALFNESMCEDSSSNTSQELYGAVAQQFCSIIDASGGFVGIKQFSKVTSVWDHLSEDVCEAILEELVAHGVLQKHPVYRQFGASAGFHELRERWQIWSNFSESSQGMDVRHNGRIIATVEVRQKVVCGDVISIGGARYKITAIHPRHGIEVVSAKNLKANIHLDGSKQRIQPNFTRAEWVRRSLVTGSFENDIRPIGAAQAIREDLQDLILLLKRGATPVISKDGFLYYLTFAGEIINSAIANQKIDRVALSGLIIRSKHPINFTEELSTFSDLLADLNFSDLFSLSTFQNLLPLELLEKESQSILHSFPIFLEIIERLRRDPLIELSEFRFKDLANII
jgi:ATP-dependent Lhr-like helicase